jgi:precorrin-2/cobalt-factor-2 C20-methyltransferase
VALQGTLYGLGVGPGDPELITVKAMNVLATVPVVAVFSKRGEDGMARRAAAKFINADAALLPLHYPYTVELSPRSDEYITAMRSFYDDAAARIAEVLAGGRDVAVLCEGDPLLYGSYMYVHDRLATKFRCKVVPGITSFSGCAASAGIPLVSTDRTFSVIPATLPEDKLERTLASSDAAVIIKLGRNLAKVRRTLERLKRIDAATYVERGTADDEKIIPLSEKVDGKAPYMSLILVPAHDGGPYRQLAKGDEQ